MATHPRANHAGNLCRIFARGMQSINLRAMPLGHRRAKTDSFHKVLTVDQQELAGLIIPQWARQMQHERRISSSQRSSMLRGKEAPRELEHRLRLATLSDSKL